MKERANSQAVTAKQPTAAKEDARVAIIGYSCILPGGENVTETWDMIRAGIDNLRDLLADRVNLDDFYWGSVDKNPVDKIYRKRGGFIPPFEFNPREFNFNMLQMEDTDANQTLSLLKVKEAMVDAGMNPSGDVKKNCGCILGIGGGQKVEPVLLAHELRDGDQGAPQHGDARGGRREGGREVQGALPRVAPRLFPASPAT